MRFAYKFTRIISEFSLMRCALDITIKLPKNSSVKLNGSSTNETTAVFSNKGLSDYKLAEKRAVWYLQKIEEIAQDPHTFTRLHKDLHRYWQAQEKGKDKRIALTQKLTTGNIDTWNFLEKLKARKELDKYLNKTVSYLYMRDLGLDLNEASAQDKVNKTVSSLLEKIEHASFDSKGDDPFFLRSFMSKKECQPAYYWLMQKLSALKNRIEDGAQSNNQANNQDGIRKLVKVVAGVLVHHLVLSDDDNKNDPDKLSEIVQLGYAYGLTYPFVDDLLDSDSFLSPSDKVLFSDTLQSTLRHRKVPKYPAFKDDSPALRAIYDELKWAFEFLLETLPSKQAELFFSRAEMFFEAQSVDRARRLENASAYSLHDILTTVIIKSASSRLISRDLIAQRPDSDFDKRTFCFGIYNQFNDDIKDIDEDIEGDNLTPYTWFMRVTNIGQKELSPNSTQHATENPYHHYWAVVYYLVYELYQNNPSIKALFFERSINALKSVFKTNDKPTFNRLFQHVLQTPNPEFNKAIYQSITQPQQEIWFDKLISTEVSTWLHNRKDHSQAFKDEYEGYKDFVNQHLDIHNHKRFDNGELHKVANYSLGAGGKRVRAVMASALSVKQYGFDQSQQIAVNQLLEYMHSASLILDDLPSQDDADMRRGKVSTHQHFNSVATAELGSVYLMMRAIEVQASIDCHPPKAVLNSLRYAANVTQAVCEGQLLDIQSKDKRVSTEHLEKICHFKTGLAIEAALVIPAILAEQAELHIQQLTRLAKHMGLMFQIRDDLLDIGGNDQELGKPTGKDEAQQRMNFVSVKGEKQAIVQMLEHYHDAQHILKNFPKIQVFFSELLDYIIYRTK